MMKQSAEDYLDKLLNSVNGDEEESTPLDMNEDTNVEVDTAEEIKPTRVSRRISKSEEDFLKEFEAELESDDFDNFLKGFDDEEFLPGSVEETAFEEIFSEKAPEESVAVDDIPLDALFGDANVEEEPAFVTEPITDSFDLGGVDLGALLNETAGDSIPLDQPEEASDDSLDLMSMLDAGLEKVETEPEQMDGEEDLFSNLLAEESTGDAVDFGQLFGESSDTSDSIDLGNLFGAEGDSSGTLDLGNLGEADLLSLLSGDGDLADLGDILSQGESGDFSMGEMDAFAAFAESEMSSQAGASNSDEKEDKKKSKKKKDGKGSLLDKIKALLLSDEDDEVELKSSKAPSAGMLSDENAEILAEMDAEDNAGKGKGGLFGKKKKEKGDKKEKKAKAPKPKKEKKPKAPKPKKEKKPKEVDNTPPLPKGPVRLIWVMVLSLLGFVYLGTNLVSYASCVNEARSYYNTGNYAEAYQELLGLTLKEKDMELYNQVATLATVDSELNAYKVFLLNEDYTKALDSLVCAAGRCELNEDNADIYGCTGQMDILKKAVSNELDVYGMTYEQALEMYRLKDREDYTIALYTKLKELGLE